MKINEIIKERRLAKKFTQEQVAYYLGVTTPAVNKWEKGISYPDITTLPALARLLETDLNTLLSFKENLTEKEIGLFLNQLSEIIDKEGFKKGYDIATEKLSEYPTCYQLVLHVAILLDGTLMTSKKNRNFFAEYETSILDLYERALCSDCDSVRNQAKSMLISKYMAKKEYEKAEELLKTIPDKNFVDKKRIQANLLVAYGRLAEAAKLEEEKLLSAIQDVQTTLIKLMEIALKENRIQDAEYIANISKKGAELFDLWEYNAYIAHFELYSTCKNRLKSLNILYPMLKSITHKWDINKSPLYRHIQTKHVDDKFGENMQKSIVQSIREDEQTAFLKDEQAFKTILKEIDMDGEEES